MAFINYHERINPVDMSISLSASEVAGLATVLQAGVSCGVVEDLGLDSLVNLLGIFATDYRFNTIATASNN